MYRADTVFDLSQIMIQWTLYRLAFLLGLVSRKAALKGAYGPLELSAEYAWTMRRRGQGGGELDLMINQASDRVRSELQYG
jgi:hypothetical protein